MLNHVYIHVQLNTVATAKNSSLWDYPVELDGHVLVVDRGPTDVSMSVTMSQTVSTSAPLVKARNEKAKDKVEYPKGFGLRWWHSRTNCFGLSFSALVWFSDVQLRMERGNAGAGPRPPITCPSLGALEVRCGCWAVSHTPALTTSAAKGFICGRPPPTRFCVVPDDAGDCDRRLCVFPAF